MTLPTSTRYKKYEPVVTTTDYLVTFPLFDDDDLEVRVDGVVTEAFSVNATYTNGRSDDAEIVLAVGVTDVDVEIYGKRVPRRDNDYASNSPQLGENLQRDIEATTAVQQEQARDFNRSILMPLEAGVTYEMSELAAARASKILAFDVSGNPTVADFTSGVPVTSYMVTLLDDASASEARATLGLGAIATGEAVASSDLDAIDETNFYTFTQAATRAPTIEVGTYDAQLLHLESSGQQTQIAFPTVTTPMLISIDDGAGYSAWDKVIMASHILDEDDMSSDDDEFPPTQQSVKAYVDNNILHKIALPPTTVEITSGYINSPSISHVTLRAEGGSGADTLDFMRTTVTTLNTGDVVIFSQNPGSTITLTHDYGNTLAYNFIIVGATDYTFADDHAYIAFMRDGPIQLRELFRRG